MNIKKIAKYSICLIFILLLVRYLAIRPSMYGDFQDQLAVLSTASIEGDLVSVKNVRNFRYNKQEENIVKDYYDAVYDASKIKNIWYITEPFKGQEYAAHTFVSFEFDDGKFLSISIEARKT